MKKENNKPSKEKLLQTLAYLYMKRDDGKDMFDDANEKIKYLRPELRKIVDDEETTSKDR